MGTPAEWVGAVVRRLATVLPHLPNPLGSCNRQLLDKTVECIMKLSDDEFASVVGGLSSLLGELNRTHPPATADGKVVESYCILLNCLTSCVGKRTINSLDDQDIQSLQQVFQKITQLCLLVGGETEKISQSACEVLYHLSALHFLGIFNKIILRVTSVNRIAFGAGASEGSSSYGGEPCVIQLIPHLNLNAARLQQILQVIVTSFKDLKRHRQLFSSIPEILHKSIWNFVRAYPNQFNQLFRNGYPALSKSAEKLFTLCDDYADNQKKKSQIWPLQHSLLLLSPVLMESFVFVEMEKSPKHSKATQQANKNFVSMIMKGLASSNKSLCESAVVCGADLFTACTYVGDRSSQIFRYFITQMQGQLQDLLFNPGSPFLHQPSSQAAGVPTFSDLDLMIKCIVAQFRLNPRNSHTFAICLLPESPPVFKLAFFQALHILLKEGQVLPWWPGDEVIHSYSFKLRNCLLNVIPVLRKYDTSSPHLVNDIKAYLQSPTSAASMLNAKGRNDRRQLVEMVTHYQLVQWLIKLYSLDPMLAFSFSDQDLNHNCLTECWHLMTGLVSLIQHHAPPHLPLNASDVLFKLHSPENIELWDRNDPMTAFWDISGQVTYSIALKLFSRKTTNPIQLLKWLKEILHSRTLFLQRHISEASQGINCKISQQLYTMLETVLLIFLRNTDIEAVQIAMSCFKYLVSEAEMVLSPNDPASIPYIANIRPFKLLEQASMTLQIGRAAQQKRIRAILKDIVHTAGSALAWEDTYASWRVTKSLLATYQKDHHHHHDLPPQDHSTFHRSIMKKVNDSFVRPQAKLEPQLSEENLQQNIIHWTNMTGFLCSMAGVSTKPSQNYSSMFTTSSSSTSLNQNPMVGNPIGDINSLPRHSVNVEPGSDYLTPLYQQQQKVKRSSSYHGNRPKSIVNVPRLATQESVRFSSSGESIASTEEGANSPRCTSQTENFISEVIALLCCDNECVGVQIRETVKELVSCELSPVVYSYLFQCLQEELAKIYQHDRQQHDPCELNTVFVDQVISILQRIMESKTEGALENLVHVKVDQTLFGLVRYAHGLGDHARSLQIKIKLCGLVQTVMQHSHELSFLQEIQFRNTLVDFFTQWVSGNPTFLFTSDYTSHEETLRSELDLCSMKATSVVLLALPLQPKDLTGDVMEEKGKLFLKYFTSFMNLVHALNSVDVSKLNQIRKQTVQRHILALRDATILAMSNMLTANIDSGLTHAIGLGYHEDLKTRTSFIEVLTSILKQGAEFDSLADTALADRYNQMLELVSMETDDDQHPIMIALINSVPFDSLDDLAEVLVVLFDYRNRLSSFLAEILSTEVEALESGRLDTLFRGNTIACKVLSICFKTFGLYYLQSVLRPLIISLTKFAECDYEVDPSRISDPSHLGANQQKLLELVQSFYKTILNSLHSLPLQLRTVCHVLYQVVVTHFPDGGLDTVNSAIFLRFINPAIVSPQSYNLIQGDIPSGVRRALTLISKVLQNLANHVEFKKEAHMEVFNEFLSENFSKSRDLALKMASMGPYMEGEAVEYIGFLKESYKYRLHSLLWNNQEKIAAYSVSTRTSITARPLFHSLNTLMAQLGAPNTPKKRTGSLATRTALGSSQLEEFLESMASECDEFTLRQIKAKEVFYQGGNSKAGNPVFYFIARKFRGDQLHYSYQLLYHTMLQLKACTDKSFELVIDVSQATQQNEPDLELLVKFAAYIPELVMNQIEAVYLYSCSIAFKAYAKKLSSAIRIFSHIKGNKRVIMITSLAKFNEYIDPSELKLPKTTTEFEQEGKEFPGCHFLVFKQHTLRIPATITIISCGFVITLTDRHVVFETPTVLKEVYHISGVREVFNEGKGALAVRLVDEGQPLKLTSPAAESIVKELNATSSRWCNQQPSRYLSERKLEPKDVPGTFLNLALLNLGSQMTCLRMAAYKLLCAVKETFKLDIEHYLDDSYDLCIPMNSSQFVLEISKTLAVKEPHLTLEFLSEVVAGFQRYSTACKQLSLAFMSPWLPNLSTFLVRTETSRAEQDKLVNIFKILVSLTISEEEMYPLIQEHVWTKMSGEPEMIRILMDNFIQMSISDGLGSRKLKVLANTAVTLARFHPNIIAADIIKRMLKTLVYTGDRPTLTLEQHFLWVELAVLAQFLLTLSFSCLNVHANLPDIFYVCLMMMGHGCVGTRAAIHGVLINSINALLSLPQVLNSDKVMTTISLTLREFSKPKFYRQFGLQSIMTDVDATYKPTHPSTSQHSQAYEHSKDCLSSSAVLTVVEHLQDVLSSCRSVFPEAEWHLRWQKLARRSSFFHNPALQTRSFLMLGVISTHASANVITRTLKTLEETVTEHEDDIQLLEAIVICLTRLTPLLDTNTKLVHHLFWVAVGIIQLGDPTLFSAALGLLETCIKSFTSANILQDQSLSQVVQIARETLEWMLNQMDRGLGVSFDSDFDFALSALLFKGFSHPLSTVRTRTQELLTILFFLHSPEGSNAFRVTEHNLAYLTALFPESDIVREQLQESHQRAKNLAGHKDEQETASYTLLLDPKLIPSYKSQILFLYMLASALLQTGDQQKILLLYSFLADASRVYQDVFPLIHMYLVPHIAQTLEQSQNPAIIAAVQQLISSAVCNTSRSSSLIKATYVNDIGFAGLFDYFSPFPKNGPQFPNHQNALFQRYLDALIMEISPSEGTEKFHSSSSISSVPELAVPLAPLLPRRSGSQSVHSCSSSREISPDVHTEREEEIFVPESTAV